MTSLTPKNDKNTLYLPSGTDLISMLESIRNHFPNTSYKDLKISAEHFHARCITYDLYDSQDYDEYIVIEG